VDSTIALPLLSAYALTRRPPRTPRRLMEKMPALMKQMTDAYDNRRKKEEASGAA